MACYYRSSSLGRRALLSSTESCSSIAIISSQLRSPLFCPKQQRRILVLRRSITASTKSRSERTITVWEQTVSASVTKSRPISNDGDENKSKRHTQGAKHYRQNEEGYGWQEVVDPFRSTKIKLSDSYLTKLSFYRNAKMSDVQNIPFVQHFLPANYPQSVCPSYATYASYCFASSIAGSAAMVLSTQALLVAVGVGNSSAAPMAAALNWVMKDGVGQLGGVMFASLLGRGGVDVGYWKSQLTKLTGRKQSKGNFQTGTADSNPKRWRMVAAIALDCSTLLEICTPMMQPSWFLPMASLANIGKNVGFLAASASRAAIHQSLCMGGSVSQTESSGDNQENNSEKKGMPSKSMSFNNNLGDVTAKSGSQAIIASLLGTALGIFLSQTFCSDHGTYGILAGFVVLSAAHQVCTYKALRAVPLKSLDRHRLHICLSDYITTHRDIILHGKKVDDKVHDVLTPMQVSSRDSFLPLMPPDDSVDWLTIGAPLIEVCPSGVDELQSLLIPISDEKLRISNVYGCEKYILNINQDDKTILLTFLEDAVENDILKGMFHAYISHEVLSNGDNGSSDSPKELSSRIIENAHKTTNEQLPVFKKHLQKYGWEVGSGYVSVECGSSHRLGIEII